MNASAQAHTHNQYGGMSSHRTPEMTHSDSHTDKAIAS